MMRLRISLLITDLADRFQILMKTAANTISNAFTILCKKGQDTVTMTCHCSNTLESIVSNSQYLLLLC